jgi:catechol 2,3-dioxygenase-like lactoylglutathione lyase family enzyme
MTAGFSIYGIQHIGLTVPNMEQAVRFFEDVFGAVTCISTGPLRVEDAYMVRKLGVPGNTRIKDIKLLSCGTGTNLELFEYEGDVGSDLLKRNSEVGGWHFAFQVDDAVAAAERLRKRGVEVLEGPNYVDSGPLERLTLVYLRAPWGQFLELVSMSGPLGYQRNGGPKLWSPLPE